MREDVSLEPLSPAEARRLYLEHRQDDTRVATRRKHASALGIFVDWTDQAGIENLNDLGGRDLLRFKNWRKEETGVNTVSLNGALGVLGPFLEFCEAIDAVEPDLSEKIPFPNVAPDEEVCDEVPDDEAVAAVRTYHGKFEYAARHHLEFELIAEIGLRMGAIRAIDLEDVDFDAAQVHLRHRPERTDEYGTPLKNGRDSERIVNVSDDLQELLSDYVDGPRESVIDTFGRESLLTTGSGRVSLPTIRRDFYKMTRPCTSADECPHGREISSCSAAESTNASECPSSFSPHPLRKWAIMRQLDKGVPVELLSGRVDVSVPVLKRHYDQRSKERKAERRRDELEKCLDEYSSL